MDILQLYQDFSVLHATEGHKHCRSGWVNTACPVCTGNPGMHLGYNLQDDYYFCWRCGGNGKYVDYILSLLLHLSIKETKEIIKQYGFTLSSQDMAKKIIVGSKEFKFPSGTQELSPAHKKYLEGRNFDPEKLIKTWRLMSTGPTSTLNKTEYKNRIIIPYEWDDKIVSFDSRSISLTASHEKRYKACPKEFEIIEHKHILYGKQREWKDKMVLVEGPTDVWRLGTHSFAVSGIQFTNEQVRYVSRVFKRVAVCFDEDPQATIQAIKIVAELKFRGVDAFKVDIKGDPGSMSQEDADYLIKNVL